MHFITLTIYEPQLIEKRENTSEINLGEPLAERKAHINTDHIICIVDGSHGGAHIDITKMARSIRFKENAHTIRSLIARGW